MLIKQVTILCALGVSLLSVTSFAKDESITALYRVDKIQKIAKKSDNKCIDSAAKTCKRVMFFKVRYKALDSLVPHQEHDISLDEELPQVGSIKQLTLAIGTRKKQ